MDSDVVLYDRTDIDIDDWGTDVEITESPDTIDRADYFENILRNVNYEVSKFLRDIF